MAGSDFLQLSSEALPIAGKSDWLTSELRRAIAEGRLHLGSRLPASRVLASELHVSRGVVTEAYRRLSEDGHLVGHGRGGTVVVASPCAPPVAGKMPLTSSLVTSPAPISAGRAVFGAPSQADVFERYRGLSAAIDLSPGVPDLSAFPRAAWQRAEHQVLDELPASALGYSDPRGVATLRQAVSDWLARNRGVAVGSDEVLVVAGVSQALALLAEVLREQGVVQRLAVEEPGSLGARQLLQYWGAQTLPVGVDEAGLVVSQLARAVPRPCSSPRPTSSRWEWSSMATGVGNCSSGRPKVASSSKTITTLSTVTTGHRSRPCGRCRRTGCSTSVAFPSCWPPRCGSVGDQPLRLTGRRCWAAKRQSDLGNAVLPQLVLARLMDNGGLERHLRSLRARHRACRDAMLQAIFPPPRRACRCMAPLPASTSQLLSKPASTTPL